MYRHCIEDKGCVVTRADTPSDADRLFGAAFLELGRGPLALLTATAGLPAGVQRLDMAYVTLDDSPWDQDDNGHYTRTAFAVVEIITDQPTIDPHDPEIRALLDIARQACRRPSQAAHYHDGDAWEVAESGLAKAS